MKILKIKCTEILNKNSFVIHFLDKNTDGITSDHFNKILLYTTTDGGELNLNLENDVTEHSVSIDLKLTFPSTFNHPNLYESIDNHQRGFLNYYNSIMNYNQSNCSEALEFNKICHDKFTRTTSIKG